MRYPGHNLHHQPLARVLLLALAFAIALACNRPDGTENPQVLSPFLLSTPTPRVTALPTGATSTPSTSTTSVLELATDTPRPTASESPTAIAASTPTPTPEPTATPIPTPTPTPTPLPTPTPIPEPLTEGAVLSDTFPSIEPSPIDGVGPEFSEGDQLWSANLDFWVVRDGKLTATTDEQVDLRLTVDTDLEEYAIRAEIARLDGLAGLVFRYVDETTWHMVWADGDILIAGQLDAGTFFELDRVAYPWPATTTPRTIELRDGQGVVAIRINGKPLLEIELAEPAAGAVGLFNRASSVNELDDFVLLPFDAAPPTEELVIPTPDLRDRGRQVFLDFGCHSCHAVGDESATGNESGPDLDGLRGRAGLQVPGLSPLEYVIESIEDPDAFVVDGFEPLQPSYEGFIGTEALDALAQYLLSLGEGELVTAPAPEPVIPNGAILYDTLTRAGDISGRVPMLNPTESTWVPFGGSWAITGRGATEESGANSDHRVVVDAGQPVEVVSASIRIRSGLAGLVYRYVDEGSWMMVWYNSETRDFHFGQIVGGVFSEAVPEPFDWGESGATHEMKVVYVDGLLQLFIDGLSIAERETSGLEEATKVGFFSRAGAGNRFTDFTVLSQPVEATSATSTEP